jgi:ADP-ribose pyrophosphatase YjhB (NUDIX family)
LLGILGKQFSSPGSYELPSTAMRFGNKQVDVVHDLVNDSFQKRLSQSVNQWREEGTPAVWLKIPAECGACVGAAIAEGFELHHVEGRTIMMSQWLKLEEDSKIQPYATHQVGVGGFVLNANQEVLVVRESDKGDWKLPGGIADLGEEIGETAKREVFEETGINAEFNRLIGFRHQHDTSFGRSNLYFVALMQLANTHDAHITMCESELIAAKWMPLVEYLDYLDRPNAASSMNLIIARLVRDSLELSVRDDECDATSPMVMEHVLPVSRRSKGGRLYYAQSDST